MTRRWKKDWNLMMEKAKPTLLDIEPGTEEEFIFQLYYGYNK